jgi:hypothetical protein
MAAFPQIMPVGNILGEKFSQNWGKEGYLWILLKNWGVVY